MTPEQQAELQILLSEKEHADKQIASYLELQLKLLAFLLGAGSLGLSFAFAKGSDGKNAINSSDLKILILVLCAAGCVVVLQTVVTYGIALGYIYYKKKTLAPRLKMLAGLQQVTEPLALSVYAFNENPARHPIFVAAAVLFTAHALGTGGLLKFVVAGAAPFWAIFGCWSLLISALVCEGLLAYAMKAVASAR